MLPFVPNFTWPDLALHYDLFMFAIAIFFAVTAASANLVPFLGIFSRGGSLLSYSKFAGGMTMTGMVPSRLGMTLLYFPACCIGLFYFVDHVSDRADIAAAMMAIHFGKRTAECLFLHKYSGQMPISSSLFISFFYCLTAHGTCHFSRLVTVFDAWTYPAGLTCFFLGIAGNFYHHYLLATLRKPGEKGYKVPRGGFFEYVAAPHYCFELIGWLGVVLVAQHLIILMIFVAMTIYLADRSIGQDEWNRKKIIGYPKHRKRMIPFLF